MRDMEQIVLEGDKFKRSLEQLKATRELLAAGREHTAPIDDLEALDWATYKIQSQSNELLESEAEVRKLKYELQLEREQANYYKKESRKWYNVVFGISNF